MNEERGGAEPSPARPTVESTRAVRREQSARSSRQNRTFDSAHRLQRTHLAVEERKVGIESRFFLFEESNQIDRLHIEHEKVYTWTKIIKLKKVGGDFDAVTLVCLELLPISKSQRIKTISTGFIESWMEKCIQDT